MRKHSEQWKKISLPQMASRAILKLNVSGLTFNHNGMHLVSFKKKLIAVIYWLKSQSKGGCCNLKQNGQSNQFSIPSQGKKCHGWLRRITMFAVAISQLVITVSLDSRRLVSDKCQTLNPHLEVKRFLLVTLYNIKKFDIFIRVSRNILINEMNFQL